MLREWTLISGEQVLLIDTLYKLLKDELALMSHKGCSYDNVAECLRLRQLLTNRTSISAIEWGGDGANCLTMGVQSSLSLRWYARERGTHLCDWNVGRRREVQICTVKQAMCSRHYLGQIVGRWNCNKSEAVTAFSLSSLRTKCHIFIEHEGPLSSIKRQRTGPNPKKFRF
jgi:hypothetical protein